MEQELIELERRRVVASFTRDTAALEDLLDEQFIFIHSNGRVDRRQDYLNLLRSGDLVYERMDSAGSRLATHGGDTAAMLDGLIIDATYFGTKLHIETIVVTTWCRTAEGWRAVIIQSTPTTAGTTQT